MSKAEWAVVSPLTGSGNKSVNVSSNGEHSGRVARQTKLTITAANVSPQYVTVNQAGKPEFTENISDTATAAQAGQVVTISGKSNSSKLTFSLGQGSLALSLPATYNAGGVVTNNGANISGDPGASAEFNWSIQFVVPENTSVSEKSRQIIVTDAAGNTDTCELTQAAGSAYVNIKKDGVSISAIELEYTGEAVSFNIESNTSWSIA